MHGNLECSDWLHWDWLWLPRFTPHPISWMARSSWPSATAATKFARIGANPARMTAAPPGEKPDARSRKVTATATSVASSNELKARTAPAAVAEPY